MTLVINGRFLSRPITGVERYGRMLEGVLAEKFPDHRIEEPSSNNAGHAWEQLMLPSRVAKNDLLISPANTGPLRVRNQVLALHDLAFRHDPEWFSPGFVRWYEWLIPRLLRRVAHVITVSEHSRQDIIRTFDLPAERITVVPPFVRSTGIASSPSSSDPYLLTIASHDPRKNLDRLVEAFLSSTSAPVRMIIVGSAHSAFRSTATRMDERISWKENVSEEELDALYRGAIAVVQPSLFEGFGLPLLEAMSVGCPVIAADIPVFRECFAHAPLHVDPHSVESIGTAMSDMIKSASLRTDHAALGHTIARRYTHARTTIALCGVLDPLLKN